MIKISLAENQERSEKKADLLQVNQNLTYRQCVFFGGMTTNITYYLAKDCHIISRKY
jgi:hypothetical protein